MSSLKKKRNIRLSTAEKEDRRVSTASYTVSDRDHTKEEEVVRPDEFDRTETPNNIPLSTQVQDEDSMSYTESEKIDHLKQWEMSNTESLLKSWGEKSGCLRWMHLKSAIYWRSVDHLLNVSSIFMSSLVSASSLFGTTGHFLPEHTIMSIVGVISMFNIINQSLQSFYDCKNKATKHDVAARQFGNFYRYVSTKLSMSRLERGPPKDILSFVVQENERLYRDNPDPHPYAIQKFKKTYLNNEDAYRQLFDIPDIVTDSFAITVYESNPLYENLINEFKMSKPPSLKRVNSISSTKHSYAFTPARDLLNKIKNKISFERQRVVQDEMNINEPGIPLRKVYRDLEKSTSCNSRLYKADDHSHHHYHTTSVSPFQEHNLPPV
jgi:hypothetical protein